MLAWSNLGKLAAYKGWHGRAPRTLLTLWEFLLWAIVGTGVWAGALWAVWIHVRPGTALLLTAGAIAGGVIGGVVAFLAHELGFQAWVVHVAGVDVADTGNQVGVDRAAVATLERWTGPIA
jgi:hypothetical protein